MAFTSRRRSSGSGCSGSARRCSWRSPSPTVRKLIGDYLGIMGVIDQNWFWFGNQGLSYIQLGRFWQIGFFVGLALWSLLVMRALWPSTALWKQAAGQFWTGRIRMEHLIWASTIISLSAASWNETSLAVIARPKSSI
jgi:nitric oxide reductase large subunit